MADAEVRGDDFYKASKALKAAADKTLRKELNQAIRKAVRPLTPKTRAAARSMLPSRGGFADLVAREPQRVQIRTGLDTAGVRLAVGKKGGGARAANEGVVRHPVFGSDRYVDQKVTPGWFDKTLEREAPKEAKPAVERAIKDVLAKIEREGD